MRTVEQPPACRTTKPEALPGRWWVVVPPAPVLTQRARPTVTVANYRAGIAELGLAYVAGINPRNEFTIRAEARLSHGSPDEMPEAPPLRSVAG